MTKRNIIYFYNRNYFAFCVILYFFTILISYFNIWNAYFVQDEWYFFGLFNQYVNSPFGIIYSLIQPITHPKLYSVHFTPLWNVIFFPEYFVFRLEYYWYAILGLSIHVIASLFVMILARKLTGLKFIGILAGLFFAVSQSHIEAVIWANTHLQTQIPTIIVIGSILLWLKGIEKGKTIYYIISLILLFTGLLIKETIFGIFLLLFIISFLYRTKISGRKLSFLYLGVTFFFYSLLRGTIPVVMRYFDKSVDTGPTIPDGIFSVGPQLYRLFTYPLKALVQQFVPVNLINNVAENITVWNYPTYAKEASIRGINYLTFAQSAGSDIVILYFAILIGILLFFIYTRINKLRNNKLKKSFIFSLIFIFSAVLPQLLIAPWLNTLFSFVTFLDSRHFYLISVGGSLLFAVTVYILYVWSKTIQKQKGFQFLPRFIIAILTLYTVINIVSVFLTINNKIVPVGYERMKIVNTIIRTFPTISDKVAFYIKSNKPYYGFAEEIPPFQTNFGHTLLVNYFNKKNYSPNFFTTGFLLKKGIIGEEYQEFDGKGFGYFINIQSLLKAVRSNNISSKNIYSFFYDGDKKITTDTTEKTRNLIRNVLENDYLTRNWNKYANKELKYGFSYPQNTYLKNNIAMSDELTNLIIEGDNSEILNFVMYKNSTLLSLNDYISLLYGLKQGSNIEFIKGLKKNIMNIGIQENVPVVIIETDTARDFIFQTSDSIFIKRITLFKNSEFDNIKFKEFFNSFAFDN